MRSFCYWVCFSLVALACAFTYGTWLLSVLEVHLPFLTLFSLLSMFGSLVPPMLSPLLPRFLVVGLSLIMLALVCRRAWLMVTKRERVPQSFVGIPKALGYIGAWSFVVALVLLLLSILLRAGSGVPAGMLALPAVLCVPWAFFLSEVISLRKAPSSAV